ncbi:MAG: hypothetical protein U1E76_05035 [Planctomycetota bacterium]
MRWQARRFEPVRFLVLGVILQLVFLSAANGKIQKYLLPSVRLVCLLDQEASQRLAEVGTARAVAAARAARARGAGSARGIRAARRDQVEPADRLALGVGGGHRARAGRRAHSPPPCGAERGVPALAPPPRARAWWSRHRPA